MKDKSSHPALVDKNANIALYDVVLVGFPIWWYVAPTIINTFLESYDYAGKTIEKIIRQYLEVLLPCRAALFLFKQSGIEP